MNTYSPYGPTTTTPEEYDTIPGREYTGRRRVLRAGDLPARKTALPHRPIGMAVRRTTVIGSADVAVRWHGVGDLEGADGGDEVRLVRAGDRPGWGVRRVHGVITFTTGSGS